MKNVIKALVLSSLALAGTNALAKSQPKKEEMNCEIKAKKKHVKDQATCEKEKGKWLVVAPVTTQPAPVAGSGSGSGSNQASGSTSGSGSMEPTK